jgi:hypothetical protein
MVEHLAEEPPPRRRTHCRRDQANRLGNTESSAHLHADRVIRQTD